MVKSHLLWCLALFTGFALAGQDLTRIGNRTIERTVQLRTHSLYAPYIDQDLQNRWWDFGGDAYVNTAKHVRLTRDRPSEMGWLWSRLPITSINFVIEVEFKISGSPDHLYGDGMAIWLTKGRATPGPVFGSMDNFEGLGIFLDTYSNARHAYSFPRIVAMLGDGKTSYDLDNDGDSNSIGACSAFYRRTNIATKLKITYLRDGLLDVKIHYKAWDDWTSCFTLKNISLPEVPFLGFSALTGDVSDDHDIIGVTTYSAILSNTNNPRGKIQLEESASSGWFWNLVKIVLFVGVIAGALYGYKIYSLKSAQSFNSYPRSPGIGGSGYGGGGFYEKRF